MGAGVAEGAGTNGVAVGGKDTVGAAGPVFPRGPLSPSSPFGPGGPGMTGTSSAASGAAISAISSSGIADASCECCGGTNWVVGVGCGVAEATGAGNVNGVLEGRGEEVGNGVGNTGLGCGVGGGGINRVATASIVLVVKGTGVSGHVGVSGIPGGGDVQATASSSSIPSASQRLFIVVPSYQCTRPFVYLFSQPAELNCGLSAKALVLSPRLFGIGIHLYRELTYALLRFDLPLLHALQPVSRLNPALNRVPAPPEKGRYEGD